MAKTSRYDLDAFIREADEIATGGYSRSAVTAIEERLRRLAAESDVLDGPALSGLHGGAADATILRRGANGSVLMLACFPPAAPTPVHDHNSWGVAHVVDGRDRYEVWRHEGGGGGTSSVSLAEEIELGPGDTVSFPPPPDDLHAQQGIDGPAWELVFFAADPNRRPRSYYRPDGTIDRRGAME